MIEALINLREMEERPYLTFVWAFLITTVAIIITSQFRSVQGISFGFFAVLFTIIPSVYFLTVLIRREERREEKGDRFWEIHGRDIGILLLFFFGITLAFAVWSFILPDGSFSTQVDKIQEIRGAVTQPGAFEAILANNIQVMVVSFILSLVFGAGAVFIIVWNASVLGVYIGQISQALEHIPLVSLGFLPHGIPEIGGYLAAALAGGILSASILRRREDIMGRILLDSLKLLGLGVLLIVVGAWIEVYV
ncbi:MAG: stage II sporulation protein M [Candidatus Aenigmarchaeota archaeon]|nr:stage II sporulation protein M [Candidatus Aenigmarchaeota archaeon]